MSVVKIKVHLDLSSATRTPKDVAALLRRLALELDSRGPFFIGQKITIHDTAEVGVGRLKIKED